MEKIFFMQVNILQQSLSLLELLMKGGWIMVILAFLSVFTAYIFFERMIKLGKFYIPSSSFFDSLQKTIYAGDLNSARNLCKTHQGPISKVLISALDKIGAPIEMIESNITHSAQLELYKLEKNISTLSTISGIAPMIGFFGTILGMINAFMAISEQEGAVSPKLLSSGIYEAMITTAGGLFVGIIAYIAYNFLVKKIANIGHKIESVLNDFMNLLQKTE